MNPKSDAWHVVKYDGEGTVAIRRAIGRGLVACGFVVDSSSDVKDTSLWPVWARTVYFTCDRDEVAYVRALAEGPPGPREMLDAAFALGGQQASEALLNKFFDAKLPASRLPAFLEDYK